MAGRIRSLKPEILDDENTANLSDRAFRLMVAGILVADDYGNLRAGVDYLRAQIWFAPRHRKVRPSEVREAMEELITCGIWEPYAASSQPYAHFRTWSKHQRTDNRASPRVPTPDHADTGTYRPFRRAMGPPAADRGDTPLDHRSPITDHRSPITDREHPRARVMEPAPEAPAAQEPTPPPPAELRTELRLVSIAPTAPATAPAGGDPIAAPAPPAPPIAAPPFDSVAYRNLFTSLTNGRPASIGLQDEATAMRRLREAATARAEPIAELAAKIIRAHIAVRRAAAGSGKSGGEVRFSLLADERHFNQCLDVCDGTGPNAGQVAPPRTTAWGGSRQVAHRPATGPPRGAPLPVPADLDGDDVP